MFKFLKFRNIFADKNEFTEVRANGVVGDISEILFRYDLMGVNFDTNISEYDFEAEHLVKALEQKDPGSDVTESVEKELLRLFDDHHIPDRMKKSQQISEEISDVWKRSVRDKAI